MIFTFEIISYACNECGGDFEYMTLKDLADNDLNTCPSCKIINSLKIKSKKYEDLDIKDESLIKKLRSVYERT